MVISNFRATDSLGRRALAVTAAVVRVRRRAGSPS
jgi:hypothetical protein